MRRFLELAALMGDGIEGVKLALRPLRGTELPADVSFAIENMHARLLEAELWLGRAVELSTKHVDDIEVELSMRHGNGDGDGDGRH